MRSFDKQQFDEAVRALVSAEVRIPMVPRLCMAVSNYYRTPLVEILAMLGELEAAGVRMPEIEAPHDFRSDWVVRFYDACHEEYPILALKSLLESAVLITHQR